MYANQWNDSISQIQPDLSVSPPSDQMSQNSRKPARSAKRKAATEREKKRMERVNNCIEDIRLMVCPLMKTPTKAKILREAINRLQYLEEMARKLTQNQKVPELRPNHPVSYATSPLNPPETKSLIAQAFQETDYQSGRYEIYPQHTYYSPEQYPAENYETFHSEGSISPKTDTSFEMITSPEVTCDTLNNNLYFCDNLY